MKKNLMIILLSLPLVLSTIHGQAAVADSSKTGFTIRQDLTLKGAPLLVYNELVLDIGNWWSSEHTYSGNAVNLSIQAVAGGCFCEKLEKGGSVKHMEVVAVKPGELLRMKGGLGPLQALAVDGSLTFTLKGEGDNTVLGIIYVVGGYAAGGLQKYAGIVDMVLGEQMGRLKEYSGKQ